MRAPSIGSVDYSPGDPPSDPAQLQAYLREEVRKLKAAIDALAAGHLDPIRAEPAKPRDGDWRYADGTDWNPGSGRGFYRFDGDSLSWVFLG